jgi:hypothetical protein
MPKIKCTGQERALGIKAVYDSGSRTKFADRFTVVLDEQTQPPYWDSIGLSVNCDSPSGVDMMGTAKLGRHLGKKISFCDLPMNVQDCIKDRLRGD